MKLLTKAIKNKMPMLYSQEDLGNNAIVHLKFFNPCGGETWYITEGNAIIQVAEGNITEKALKDIRLDDNVLDIRFYGLITGTQFDELGYFSFNELKSIGSNPKMTFRDNTITIRDLGLERDLYFNPQPLKNFVKDI